jgi:arylsulfatase A
MRKTFLSNWSLLLALFATITLPSEADAGQSPNIIYIMLDDAGYGDFGCYGQKKFSTPNIDRMAREGMRFTQHYAGSTVCAPTRCSLMSGVHTGHAFIRGNKEIQPEGQWPLPADLVTVPKLLKGAGYVTGMFGKWGLGAPGSEGDPKKQGWDEFYGYNCQREAHTFYPSHLWQNDQKIPLDKGAYSADLIAEQTLKFIRDHADEKFFTYVPWTIPHAAMHVPEEDAAPFRVKFPEFEDTIGKYKGPEVRNPVAAFAGMMTRVDRHVGQILDLLQELGIAEETLVFFTSDNGPHLEGGHRPDFFDSNGILRGHKRDLYEGGIRVPLIAWAPNRIAAGTVNDHISAHWDFLPTACELAGVNNVPDSIDGLSMVPTLLGDGKKQKRHPYLYWEFPARGSRQAIRMGKWKAVRLNLAKNRDAPIELYNLNKDPSETHDIAARHEKVVNKIRPLFESARVPSDLFRLFPNKD